MAPPNVNNGSTHLTTIPLNTTLMGKLKPAKIFKNSVEPTPLPSPGTRQQPMTRQITGLSFDDRGDQLITAAEDETFRLYSCKSGKHLKTLYSKKYGVDLPRFTHKNTAVIHASTKEDDTVRYHSLHDNKYLQYFRGHTDRVISLEMSPVDDGFMSASMDRTVRLWDLRSPACRGLLTLPAPSIVAYDSSGVVFAVAVNQYSRILMYDVANYDKEPFLMVALDDPTLTLVSFPPRAIFMTSLSFSSDGKYLLVGCSGDAHYILDAFEGQLLAKLEGFTGLERRKQDMPLNMNPQRGSSGEEVSWTPDSKFIVSGSVDGKIAVWDAQQIKPRTDPTAPPLRLQPLAKLDGHPGPTRCVKFNPRLAMMATAGNELAFWLPDQSADADEIAKELLKK
ncbi:WD40 repeat-like protein [Vararia minispora EC-137]|uniref:WD40 repeat-like protein n=1 Tax=Vararia minispora EC-137 TaxID=1314806 RepID=A0ACB8QDF0_9AGAM|nr:WD40 repeat-like protein [Vararia minispora EC-137]